MRESNARPSTEVGMTHWTRWSAMAVVASLITVPLGAQSHTVVTNDMLRNAAGSGDWLMYGGNYWNNRFSPLKKINTTNVKLLVPRAIYTHGSSTLGSFETTPVVVNGIMYITSPVKPNNIVRAFDLRSQKMLWEHVHKTGPVSTACCGYNNRGVAVANGMVYVATLDGQMIALDQQTGEEKWAVQVGDPAAGYTFTMAPLAIGDKVIAGTSGGEYGIRGWVKAFNGATGALAWTWYSIPSPEDGGWWGTWAKTTPEGNDLHRDIRKSDAFVPQQNMFALPTPEGTFMLPGANGGSEWSPIAVNPGLAYAYTVGLHQPMHYKTHYAPWERGRVWLGSAFLRIPDVKGDFSGEYGNVNAIDLKTGKIAWSVKTEQPMMGGATATAGGLVFTGEGNGWFKAYDAKTGAVLWKFNCGAGANAAPSVFEVDGEQFIAVAAGGNFQLSFPLGNTVFVFGLPKTGR